MNNSNASNTHQANLIDTVAAQGTLGTFSKAINAAGLANILNGPGPFTVFAPTDEAFAALGPELLNRLLADEERLNDLLRYHVLQGRYTASDLTGLDTVTTLEGSDLQVETDDGLRLDEATVVQPDLEADNGVVHGLDQVMLPEKYLY